MEQKYFIIIYIVMIASFSIAKVDAQCFQPGTIEACHACCTFAEQCTNLFGPSSVCDTTTGSPGNCCAFPTTTAMRMTTTTGPISVNCGDGYHNLNGRCYKFYDLSQERAAAEQYCQIDNNADLASIFGGFENNFLLQMALNGIKKKDVLKVWFGLYYDQIGGEYRWQQTGQSLGAYPNLSDGDCVVMTVDQAKNAGQWMNEDCKNMNAFFCEQR